MMREAGIGRPSTYAKAIENNRRHGYVVISKYRQNLIPTRRGFEAVNVIKAIAPELLTPRYTARLVRLMEGVDERVPYEVAILLPVANYVEMKLASLEVKNLGGSESSVGVVEGEVR
jgi:reverse gyrase